MGWADQKSTQRDWYMDNMYVKPKNMGPVVEEGKALMASMDPLALKHEGGPSGGPGDGEVRGARSRSYRRTGDDCGGVLEHARVFV